MFIAQGIPGKMSLPHSLAMHLCNCYLLFKCLLLRLLFFVKHHENVYKTHLGKSGPRRSKTALKEENEEGTLPSLEWRFTGRVRVVTARGTGLGEEEVGKGEEMERERENLGDRRTMQ